MNLLKNRKGITLIALVITIIVILILAGVSIMSMTSENGMLNKVVHAKERMQEAEDKEQIELAVLGSYGEEGILDLDELVNNLEQIENVISVTCDETYGERDFPVTVEIGKKTYEIDGDGNIQEVDPNIIIEYTIRYELNGGTLENRIESYNKNTETFTLPEPVKNGYTFTGWTGTGYSVATKDIEIMQGSTGNRKYTANWVEKEVYSITYDLDGGTIESGNFVYSYKEDTEDFTLPILTKSDYIFIGWTGTDLMSVTKLVTVTKGSTGNREYVANWVEKERYVITYNLDGGIIENGELLYSYKEDTEDYTLPTPTRTGYTFTGWTGTDLSLATMTVTIAKGSTGNRNYTANWQMNTYTITFDANGGKSAPSAITHGYASAVTMPTTMPTKSGYKFIGWSETGTASSTIYLSSTSSDKVKYFENEEGDKTLKAIWADSKLYIIQDGKFVNTDIWGGFENIFYGTSEGGFYSMEQVSGAVQLNITYDGTATEDTILCRWRSLKNIVWEGYTKVCYKVSENTNTANYFWINYPGYNWGKNTNSTGTKSYTVDDTTKTKSRMTWISILSRRKSKYTTSDTGTIKITELYYE